jgi:hypothetical protein
MCDDIAIFSTFHNSIMHKTKRQKEIVTNGDQAGSDEIKNNHIPLFSRALGSTVTVNMIRWILDKY